MPRKPAGGGGAAAQPDVHAGGLIPADPAGILPDGFDLPAGYALVAIPEVTPEQQVAGAVEHASMCAGLYQAGLADLERVREHAAGMVTSQEAGVARLKEDADAAAERARDVAAGHGIEIGGDIPPHPLFAHLPGPDGETA